MTSTTARTPTAATARHRPSPPTRPAALADAVDASQTPGRCEAATRSAKR